MYGYGMGQGVGHGVGVGIIAVAILILIAIKTRFNEITYIFCTACLVVAASYQDQDHSRHQK